MRIEQDNGRTLPGNEARLSCLRNAHLQHAYLSMLEPMPIEKTMLSDNVNMHLQVD